MKILLLLIILTTSQIARGQSANQRDLVDILEIALRTDKLPSELVIKSNQWIDSWANAPFVVVRIEESMNLERIQEPTDNNHVWIFSKTEIFEYVISYGLIPTNITRKNDYLTLDFKTAKFAMDTNSTCHSGRLKAKEENNSWTIIKVKTKEIKCENDMFGLKK